MSAAKKEALSGLSSGISSGPSLPGVKGRVEIASTAAERERHRKRRLSRRIRIELERELPRGELISVETAEGSLQCIVRRVKETPRGRLIGVEVMAASDGSNHRRSLDNLRIALAAEENGAHE